ncbi:three-helix bundle dimerization domain-containing protein [Blastococcus atacamensis]|uniref:three-helix bundle dimerization domain-containing protein n=1 Tax=Blastococcus atacamensis TaxID=2070508 RepID=UPI000CEC53EE|nr:hypothetical protein [Blastococcus atacamensis]
MTLVVPPIPGPAADEPARALDDAATGEPVRAAAGDRSDAEPLDDSVTAAVGRLSWEFSDRVGPHLVVRVVRDCRRELGGSPVGALPELVERLARYRLDRQIG